MKSSTKNIVYITFGILLITIASSFAFAAPTSSQCDAYIEDAKEEATQPYPDYLSSGEKYFSAARCYERVGEESKAEEAYEKSAEQLSKVAEVLGNHRLAAESHEKAAISYEAIGRTSEALENYEKAMLRYQSAGNSVKAQEMGEKIEEMKEESTPIQEIRGNARSIIGLISLTVLFLSILVLILIGIANFANFGKEAVGEEKPDDETPGLANIESKEKEKEEEENLERTKKKKSPRQRAIEKLREKYKP